MTLFNEIFILQRSKNNSYDRSYWPCRAGADWLLYSPPAVAERALGEGRGKSKVRRVLWG